MPFECNAQQIVEVYLGSQDCMLFAQDAEFRFMSHVEPLRGREAIDAILRIFFREAFSKARVEVCNMVVGKQGTVVVEFMFHGMHTGLLMGAQPTGNRVAVPMIAVFEVEQEEIKRARLYYDTRILSRQVGLALFEY
jgi:predicted ester cyclase